MFYEYKGKKYLLNLIDTPVCLNTELDTILSSDILDRYPYRYRKTHSPLFSDPSFFGSFLFSGT